MEDDCAWLDARIAKTKTLIEKYEDAITAVGAGAQSYMLDTGQTRQSVTKANLSSVMETLNSLHNLLATLQARRFGGSVTVKPVW